MTDAELTAMFIAQAADIAMISSMIFLVVFAVLFVLIVWLLIAWIRLLRAKAKYYERLPTPKQEPRL